MTSDINEREWEKLQFRIDKLVGHYLKEDLPAIEDKSPITGLLQLPPEYNDLKIEEIM